MQVLTLHLAFLSFLNPVSKYSLKRNLDLIRFNKIGFQMWPVRNRYDRVRHTLTYMTLAFILGAQGVEIGPGLET